MMIPDHSAGRGRGRTVRVLIGRCVGALAVAARRAVAGDHAEAATGAARMRHAMRSPHH
ncbi:hypothetical protein AB0D97_24795 [Streptomyces roseus]|uniref:hypothetical protein n=1 Tax=Streptomyces roseus TaxID=66430 RepID=UPI0033EBBE2C